MTRSSRRWVTPLTLLLLACSGGRAQEAVPPPSGADDPKPPEIARPEIPNTPEIPETPGGGVWRIEKGRVHHGRAVKFVQAVQIDGTLDGELWAMAKDTRVSGRITGDMQSMGELAVLTGEVDENVRLIVGEARIDGVVHGDLDIKGGKIVIGPKARIEGEAVLLGQEVEILGTIDGEVKVAGGVFRLSGVLGTDARVDVDEFVVDPGARIQGDLGYSARKSTDLRGTGVVKGSIEEDGRTIAEAPAPPEGPVAVQKESDEGGGGAGFFIGFYLFLLVVGTAVLAVARRWIPSLIGHLRAEPLQCVGVGFLAWLSPFAAIFVCILVVTIPLVLAYWLLFAVVMALAYVPVAAWIGTLLFARLGRESTSRYAQFAAGLGIWWILVQIPVLGVIVLVATFLAGPGTFVMAIREGWVNRRRRTSPPAPPVAVPATS